LTTGRPVSKTRTGGDGTAGVNAAQGGPRAAPAGWNGCAATSIAMSIMGVTGIMVIMIITGTMIIMRAMIIRITMVILSITTIIIMMVTTAVMVIMGVRAPGKGGAVVRRAADTITMITIGQTARLMRTDTAPVVRIIGPGTLGLKVPLVPRRVNPTTIEPGLEALVNPHGQFRPINRPKLSVRQFLVKTNNITLLFIV